MIFIATVTNSVSQLFSDGVRRMRVITASLFGAKVAPEASPAGYDGNPIPGLAAVFAETSKKGKPVFIGYINANQLSDVGEVRIYATDANGVEKARVWLHNSGLICVKNMNTGKDLFTILNNVLTLQQNLLNVLATASNIAVTGSTGQFNPAALLLITDYQTEIATYLTDLASLLSAT